MQLHRSPPSLVWSGCCLFLENSKKDILETKCKKMQSKNGPPKIRMQKKCKTNANPFSPIATRFGVYFLPGGCSCLRPFSENVRSVSRSTFLLVSRWCPGRVPFVSRSCPGPRRCCGGVPVVCLLSCAGVPVVSQWCPGAVSVVSTGVPVVFELRCPGRVSVVV